MLRLGESGQAAVEAALTLPLTLFLVLGTLQLFMLLQARIVAHYALARATRAGSVDHANCTTMSQVTLAALLPTFARTDSPAALGEAFRLRKQGAFDRTKDGGRYEEIFWLTRLGPIAPPATEEELFDLQGRRASILEMELVYWYPLRIPFANWVMARISVAQYRLGDLSGVNPLMPVQRDPDWQRGSVPVPPVQGGDLGDELVKRTDRGNYVLPIKATYAVRMLTPVRGPRGTCPLQIPVLP